MPQYPMPPDYPDWSQGLPSQVSAPTPSLRASGFTQGQRPAFSTINYLFYRLGSWVRYFGQGLSAVMVGASTEPTYRLILGGMWSWNATTGVLSWSESFSISMAGLADSANTVAAGSVTLSPGQLAYVQSNAPFSTTGDTTSGSAQVSNLAFESGISVGQTVTGTGIAAGATVLSVSAQDSSITLSAPATATASGVNIVFSSSGTLSVQAAAVQSLAPSANTVVIARCAGASGTSMVYVGINSGQMLLRHGESKPLLSNGYVTTQRITAGPPIGSNAFVYLSQGADIASFFRSGNDTTQVPIFYQTNSGNQIPANQFAVGDYVSSTNGNSRVTAVSATGTLTLSPPLPVNTNEGSNPNGFPLTPVTVGRQPGLLYPTDASLGVPLQRAQTLGVVPAATAAGSVAHVVQSGTVNGFSGLTVGVTYFLRTNQGDVGLVSPGMPPNPGQTSVPAALAISPTSLLLNPSALGPASLNNNGYKSVIDMGFFYNTNTTSSGLQSTVDAIYYAPAGTATTVHRHVFTHSGSVVGISAHLANTVSPITTIFLGKQSGQFAALNIPPNTNDGFITFPKGLLPFVAGDPLYAYVYFAGLTGQNCALRVYATVEFNPQ